MLFQGWASVVDGGSTLKQHCVCWVSGDNLLIFYQVILITYIFCRIIYSPNFMEIIIICMPLFFLMCGIITKMCY